jgi:hypothetical protein
VREDLLRCKLQRNSKSTNTVGGATLPSARSIKTKGGKEFLTHLDAIGRRRFGASTPNLGWSSSVRCRFGPSLCSEGPDSAEWPVFNGSKSLSPSA